VAGHGPGPEPLTGLVADTGPHRGLRGRVQAATDGTLLGHSGFRRLWFGQTVSVFGSQVTVLALPLAAVLVLHASTFQVGLLTTAEYAAFLVIGLPTGVWVDRMRRRPIMITADVLRAVTLASVPAAYALGLLTLAQLYLVALVQGVGTVFFDVAYMSYLPGLVGRDHLVESNAKLQVSQSVAQVSGPTVSGLLIGLLSAPVAFVADAASFVVSAGSLLTISGREPPPEHPEAPNLLAEIGEGLRFVATEPVLRMIAGATSTGNLFGSAFFAVSVVFLVRQIGLGASTIGILSSAAAIGGVVGALSATWLRRRVGSARIIWVSMTVCAPCALLIPLTSPGPGLLCYAAGSFMTSFGIIVYNVNQASFRQLRCPPRLLGRMNATMRFIVWGTLPLGGVLGGALGTWLGNRNALWVAVTGTALSPIWLLASPLRRMRDIPQAADRDPAEGARKPAR
jgi:MFS family permease